MWRIARYSALEALESPLDFVCRFTVKPLYSRCKNPFVGVGVATLRTGNLVCGLQICSRDIELAGSTVGAFDLDVAHRISNSPVLGSGATTNKRGIPRSVYRLTIVRTLTPRWRRQSRVSPTLDGNGEIIGTILPRSRPPPKRPPQPEAVIHFPVRSGSGRD